MEHNRKQKLLMIVALIAAIASLSIGFAAFSVTLNISSSASVTPSSDTFSVKFSTSEDSLVVGDVSPSSNINNLDVTNGKINNTNNPTISNLSATFTKPGQYVVYTFYARNEGEYTAYLNSVNFIGENVCIGETGTTESLVQSACDYISLSVVVDYETYTNTTAVTGQSLLSGFGEKIMIKLTYDETGPSVDGPFSINFPNIALVYSTTDDSTISPKVVRLESGSLDGIGAVVSIGREKFYVISKENDKVKMLSMYNLHVGNIKYNDTDDSVPLSNPLGIQDEDALGYGFDVSHPLGIFPWVGLTSYSDHYAGSTYSGSNVEAYVNNYADYLTHLGANVSDARLITKEELNSIGCYSDGETCTGAQDWVYATSYWTMSAYDSGSVWRVERSGYFTFANVTMSDSFGVRPLIEIPLSEF